MQIATGYAALRGRSLLTDPKHGVSCSLRYNGEIFTIVRNSYKQAYRIACAAWRLLQRGVDPDVVQWYCFNAGIWQYKYTWNRAIFKLIARQGMNIADGLTGHEPVIMNS